MYDKGTLVTERKQPKLLISGITDQLSLPQGILPSLVDVYLVGIDIVYGLRFTAGDALRIAITEITLDGDTLNRIEEGYPEGAGKNAGSATDALFPVNEDCMRLRIPVAGFCRTHLGTERLLTVSAYHREREPNVIPFHHSDPGATGVAGAGVKYGTNHLALPAPGTSIVIDYQFFLLHQEGCLLE